MAKVIVSNAFSLNMLEYCFHELIFEPVPVGIAKNLCLEGFESVVGHESTAKVFSQALGVHVAANRTEYRLRAGDMLLVGVLGKRLPEGVVLSKEELQDFPISWWVVRYA